MALVERIWNRVGWGELHFRYLFGYGQAPCRKEYQSYQSTCIMKIITLFTIYYSRSPPEYDVLELYLVLCQISVGVRGEGRRVNGEYELAIRGYGE